MKKAESDGQTGKVNELNAKNTSLSQQQQRKVSTDNLIENFAEDGWYQVRNTLLKMKIRLKMSSIFRIRKLVNCVMIRPY